MKNYFIVNWKMSLGREDTLRLFGEYEDRIDNFGPDVEVVICPSPIYLPILDEKYNDEAFQLGAQNCSNEYDLGAFTGEISAKQIADFNNVTYGMVGHSEPRYTFGETDQIVAKKFHNFLKAGIKPILCVSETIEQRENNQTEEVIENQIQVIIDQVGEEELNKVEFLVAYEPAWAISTAGSSRKVTPEDVSEVVTILKVKLEEYGDVPIFYGGSVKPDNANQFMSIPGIDGLVVGSASLDSYKMSQIVENSIE